ncbi:MAG: site-specific integrase, partial [Lachnospiraceae bacterium]|nr:site-specific integrase [Lachnospiraceae bacterium]
IGKKLLKDVSTIHCQMIMNKMADKGYRTSTICQARITLYSMLDYALHNDVITKNPCNGIVKSDIGKASRKREALSIAQQKLFVNGINSNSYEIQYRFLLQTGLRTGELVGLKWEDIDFEKRNLTVSRSMEFRHSVGEWKVGPPKSKLSYRTIPLTDEAVELLKMQKSKNADIHIIPIEWSEFVFLCRKGTPVKNSTYDTMLFKLCDKIGIPKFSMHILRHTFATRCIEAGMKPKTLQMILGHANIGITMNLYVHTTEDEKLKEINMVANSLKVV